MSQRSQLVKKLRQFTENFRAIKKLSPINEPSERQQYQNILSANRQLIEVIQLYFKEIYNSHQNDVATDKLRKQFINLLSNYEQHLKIYQQHEDRQVRQLRKTYTQLRSSIIERQRKRSSVAESDKYGMEIQMVEINQQTLHYERMIQIKEKEIKTIKDRMQGALEVQEVLKTLVDEQGQMLDQAEVNINQAHDNVKEAHQNLIEGQKQHISSKKKQCCIFTIVLVILLAIIVPLIIKFA